MTQELSLVLLFLSIILMIVSFMFFYEASMRAQAARIDAARAARHEEAVTKMKAGVDAREKRLDALWAEIGDKYQETLRIHGVHNVVPKLFDATKDKAS